MSSSAIGLATRRLLTRRGRHSRQFRALEPRSRGRRYTSSSSSRKRRRSQGRPRPSRMSQLFTDKEKVEGPIGDGGGGAELVASLPTPPAPQAQPPCISDPSSGVVDCSNWSESASWTVPTNAAPGVYDALLQRSDTNDISHIVFVVSDEPGTTEE